jgi:hypothetical protein
VSDHLLTNLGSGNWSNGQIFNTRFTSQGAEVLTAAVRFGLSYGVSSASLIDADVIAMQGVQN